MARLGLILLALVAALAVLVVACGGDEEEKKETPAAGALEGMWGTAAGVGDIGATWRSEFEAEFDKLPPLPYITESYDAVIMVALGAEKAQSTDPTKIRDAMRTLNDPKGEKIPASAAGIKQALELIREDKAINYQGASGFAGWDAKGDVLSGYIEVWKIENSEIVTVRTEAVTLTPATEAAETPAAETPAAPPPAAGGGPLKIGVLFSFTGDLSEFGPNMENGAKLAALQVNTAGGVLGEDVVLKRADDQTSPNPAVQAAQQLVDVEGVQAVIGGLASSVTIAVASAVTIPSKIIQISPASTSVAVTALEDNDFVFRTTVSDLAQGPILAKVAQERGYKKVSTLYVNNPYGQGLSEAFADAFEKLGGEVPAQVSVEQEQPSYLAELRKATEGKPDALAALSYPQSAAVYLKEALENNLINTFLFCDGTKSEDIIKAVQ